MFFALCRFEIFIPEGHSLKAKRSVLNRIKERLRVRFRAAVAEVDGQDLWQRATLGAAMVGLRPAGLEEGLAAMRRLVEEEPRCQILVWETRIEPFGGLGGEIRGASSGPGATGTEPAEEAWRWEEPDEDDEHYGPPRREAD